MTDTRDIVERLRELGQGYTEWRVQDPVTGSYCIAFDRGTHAWPEQAARDWLADHVARFPNSMHADKVVAEARVQTQADKAMCEAADEITRLRAALSQQAGWQEAVQRLVTGFEHVSGIARQWEPDHSSGADRAKWARATEACADVARLLAAAPQPGAQDG